MASSIKLRIDQHLFRITSRRLTVAGLRGPYPIATFEATDAGQLRREFERSVDEYLKWCEEDGVEPRRPFSGKLNLRLGSELHALVAAAAGANQMSINSWIVRAVRGSIGVRPADSGGRAR